jgi:hypothetical protein
MSRDLGFPFFKSGPIRSQIRIYSRIRPGPDTDLSWDTGTGAGFNMVDGEMKVLENRFWNRIFINGKTGFGPALEKMTGLPIFWSRNPVHLYQDPTRRRRHFAAAWLLGYLRR